MINSNKMNNFMKSILLLVQHFTCLSFIFFASCSRDKEPEDEILTTVIEGRVLTRGTEDVVPDGPHLVTLSAADRNGYLDTAFTDETGHYKLVYTAANEGIFNPVEFRPNFHGNYPEGYIENAYILGSSARIDNLPAVFSGDHQVNNIFLYRKGWLNIHVVNLNPNPLDRIRISTAGTISDIVLLGAQDTVLKLNALGNIFNLINYWTTSEGVSTPMRVDSVFIGDLDTGFFKIEY